MAVYILIAVRKILFLFDFQAIFKQLLVTARGSPAELESNLFLQFMQLEKHELLKAPNNN